MAVHEASVHLQAVFLLKPFLSIFIRKEMAQFWVLTWAVLHACRATALPRSWPRAAQSRLRCVSGRSSRAGRPCPSQWGGLGRAHDVCACETPET